jgi:hypothetical protein
MPVQEALMDAGSWEVTLKESTPNYVLNAIDVRDYLWSSIVITPTDFRGGVLSDADLLANAVYVGVYLGQGGDRRSLYGQGLAWWLGDSGDGGQLHNGIDGTSASAQFSTQMNAIYSNGLTAGTTDSTATAFTWKYKGGDTRREMLDTLCQMAPGGPNFWRVNGTTFTIDADDQTTLWPTTSTPTVVLASSGSRDGNIVGFEANLDLAAMNGEEIRSTVYVRWDEATPGTNIGSSSPTLPSTYVDLVGGAPDVYALLDFSPKRPRPPTERWRRVAAWMVTTQGRANSIAAREAAERTNIRQEVTAELADVYAPWRFDITPGNSVYLWDLELGLSEPRNVQYMGETISPITGRVDEMETPIQDGYGVYLRYWTGAAFAYYRLTDYVEFEEGPTTLKINHRDRFPVFGRRAKRVTRRQRRHWRAWAHQQARLARLRFGD